MLRFFPDTLFQTLDYSAGRGDDNVFRQSYTSNFLYWLDRLKGPGRTAGPVDDKFQERASYTFFHAVGLSRNSLGFGDRYKRVRRQALGDDKGWTISCVLR